MIPVKLEEASEYASKGEKFLIWLIKLRKYAKVFGMINKNTIFVESFWYN